MRAASLTEAGASSVVRLFEQLPSHRQLPRTLSKASKTCGHRYPGRCVGLCEYKLAIKVVTFGMVAPLVALAVFVYNSGAEGKARVHEGLPPTGILIAIMLMCVKYWPNPDDAYHPEASDS
ncbi:hypothetical protein [Alloactinosynnema sp. L-07]|uniref:hypothetical protein n=1 Tax=Alloactinosynnema sp. L-07 TaxID=1653480 RepID=UPI00065EFC95|nr:hypothetical protein [Alloactinosynnema sp. L-07]CRK59583.1 hypothetical protein [Alloactinosynnema sp. L-07]